MNWQRRFCCVVVASTLSFFSPSLLAQNCSNNQAPVANAGPDRSGNIGVAINFTGAGTDSDGTITSYWFNFGDGSFASWQSSPLASHSFASAGTFSVRLWVKDNCGAMSAADTAILTITQAPANPCAGNTAPIANAGPDRAGNPNVPLLLTGYASADAQNNLSHYWWNFGDGQYTGWQTSAGVSHAFANTGNYSVRLWVKDSCGAMSAADTVIVNILNPNPCTGNTPPNAIITSPSSGLVNQSLNFSGLSSSDSTGTIQSYSWNFGDGQSGNGVNVSHSYASAGNKTVTLTLTDSCGAQGSMTRTIVISNPDPCAGNQPPIAQASANPANANINQAISFSAAGSSDPNGSITSYAWNFGDGSNGSGANASHAYASAGSFNVILTVTDNCGATATKTISVNITNPNQGLQADFKVYKLTHVDSQTGAETWEEIVPLNANNPVELGLRLKFDSSPSTGPIASRSFNFGPGDGASGVSVVHVFNTAGPRNVTLTVSNANWTLTNSVTKTIHVAAGMQLLNTIPGGTGTSAGIAILNDTAWAIGINPGSIRTVALAAPGGPAALDDINVPSSGAYDFAVSPSLVAVSSLGAGVYLFDATDPANLGTVDGYDINLGSACPTIFKLALVPPHYLYVGCGTLGIQIVDLSNPLSPVLLEPFSDVGNALGDMKVVGNLVYVGTGGTSAGPSNPPRIKVLDISDPVHPAVVGQVEVQRRARNIAVSGNVLAVAENEYNLSYSTGTIAFFDLSQSPFQPQFKGRVGDNLTVYRGVAIVGNNAFATYAYGIRKIDITRLNEPYFVSEFSLDGYAPVLAPYGDKLIVGSSGSTAISVISTGLQP